MVAPIPCCPCRFFRHNPTIAETQRAQVEFGSDMVFSNERTLCFDDCTTLDDAWFTIGNAPEAADGRLTPRLGCANAMTMAWGTQPFAIFGISMQFEKTPPTPPVMVISTFGGNNAVDDVIIPYETVDERRYDLPFTLEQPLFVDQSHMMWMREITRVNKEASGRATLCWSAMTYSTDVREMYTTRCAQPGGMGVRHTPALALRYEGGFVYKAPNIERDFPPLFALVGA